ncbi:MAG: hypothetical protein WC622_07105, partial [Pedobacter sp.]|uniref:hypothetical protein n=1 Tax=Pedobacter sp. TaxID=1411316 RepID=UPI0035621E4D
VILYEWFQICYYEGDSQVPFFCDPPYKEEVGSYEMCWDGDPCEDPMNAYLIECGGDGTPPEGGGGGPGDPPNNEQMDWGTPTDEEHVVTILSSDSVKKAANLTWFFHKTLGGAFNFLSNEKAIVVKASVSANWKFESLDHLNTSGVGNIISGFPEMNLINTSILGTDAQKTVNLTYKEGRTSQTSGGWVTVWYTGTFNSSSVWRAAEIGSNY